MNVAIGILRHSIACEDSGLSDGKFVRKDSTSVRSSDIGESKDLLDIFQMPLMQLRTRESVSNGFLEMKPSACIWNPAESL